VTQRIDGPFTSTRLRALDRHSRSACHVDVARHRVAWRGRRPLDRREPRACCATRCSGDHARTSYGKRCTELAGAPYCV